ncbi:HU family DNA-binding protein [Roseofilum casamattae]|uniref:HU family DNA-binding protein n=1 Tax=Roseofilum casamattae BLCC-M143 TaxID=3022442 RepID=A0ABT7C005_9CYAN|nr:HU family DNA-binding protein [Roseofilum casamattae]MDJ1184783.1 HU family DNA-binding protein [Roseofilum casamattae BLCC-M143]
MNKSKLIDEVALRSGCSKKHASDVVNNTLAAIVDAVSAGERVTLVGFGTFKPEGDPQRHGRNPKTGEIMTIPGIVVPVFMAGKAFKEKVQDSQSLPIARRDLQR